MAVALASRAQSPIAFTRPITPVAIVCDSTASPSYQWLAKQPAPRPIPVVYSGMHHVCFHLQTPQANLLPEACPSCKSSNWRIGDGCFHCTKLVTKMLDSKCLPGTAVRTQPGASSAGERFRLLEVRRERDGCNSNGAMAVYAAAAPPSTKTSPPQIAAKTRPPALTRRMKTASPQRQRKRAPIAATPRLKRTQSAARTLFEALSDDT